MKDDYSKIHNTPSANDCSWTVCSMNNFVSGCLSAMLCSSIGIWWGDIRSIVAATLVGFGAGFAISASCENAMHDTNNTENESEVITLSGVTISISGE